jgi:hypothetical protein
MPRTRASGWVDLDHPRDRSKARAAHSTPGSPHHKPRGTNSPMVEALGPGEFWRAPGEWFEYGRALAPDLARASRAPSGSPLRIETVWRELSPGPASGHGAHTVGTTR